MHRSLNIVTNMKKTLFFLFQRLFMLLIPEWLDEHELFHCHKIFFFFMATSFVAVNAVPS